LRTPPASGDPFFLARATRFLHQALSHIFVLLSYSDSVPRVLRGYTTKPGHLGTIYAALNGFEPIYHLPFNRTQAIHLLGNAVCPPPQLART